MKKFIQNKLKDQKGLTLIELLAVIVILAIIAAIAIPAIGSMIENSRNGAVKADFQNAISSANIYFTENPQGMAASAGGFSGTVTVQELVKEKYLDDKGSLKDAVVITKAAGGNTISGSAEANGKTYTLKSALTNAQLTSIKNANFTGTSIAPAP
ncbi:prepilin-type N-terminal cleavage/methylation domain-containing protein [Planococcus maritimus]|uniref:Prepilin-type N-terminal cleavage/methylation domain-containing protein n=1 Tax=Planococcus maritimus TaxID=192421 RepID=A0A7D7RFU9_PLAMR|nr:prepilin-type N-terminal cleavage/methylation domain-containing protein [Planococcus maritimus]QMT18700.1 prepilin-type N-terminal cleavage/methylation domain-containing protein [Planococcus maritimus]